MKTILAKIALIWRRLIADNLTDSNGDVDIVRVAGVAAAIIGLWKFAHGSTDAQSIAVALGGLTACFAAKAVDPKPDAK